MAKLDAAIARFMALGLGVGSDGNALVYKSAARFYERCDALVLSNRADPAFILDQNDWDDLDPLGAASTGTVGWLNDISLSQWYMHAHGRLGRWNERTMLYSFVSNVE